MRSITLRDRVAYAKIHALASCGRVDVRGVTDEAYACTWRSCILEMCEEGLRDGTEDDVAHVHGVRVLALVAGVLSWAVILDELLAVP
jgi:hypothetical protein